MEALIIKCNGGENCYILIQKNQYAFNGQVGSSFNNYIGVITGRSNATEGDTTTNGGNDAFNRFGNHLGTIDFGFEVSAKNFSLLIYRQNIYEDGSLAYLNNISDGLNGISINIKKEFNSKIKVQKIIFEYLNTSNQGGIGGSENTNSRLRGQDNYFSNSVYQNGWSYYNKSLGTSFINSVDITSGTIINNRVQSYYLGFGGTWKRVNLTTKISYSNIFPFFSQKKQIVKNQYSVVIKGDYTLKNENQLIVSIAYDDGTLFKNSIGLWVSFRKNLTNSF